jgi:hypothetical protein
MSLPLPGSSRPAWRCHNAGTRLGSGRADRHRRGRGRGNLTAGPASPAPAVASWRPRPRWCRAPGPPRPTASEALRTRSGPPAAGLAAHLAWRPVRAARRPARRQTRPDRRSMPRLPTAQLTSAAAARAGPAAPVRAADPGRYWRRSGTARLARSTGLRSPLRHARPAAWSPGRRRRPRTHRRSAGSSRSARAGAVPGRRRPRGPYSGPGVQPSRASLSTFLPGRQAPG